MRGRGSLYKWGPNNAADPVIIREPQRGRYQLLVKNRKRPQAAAGESDWLALPGQMAEQDMYVGTKLREFLIDEVDGDALLIERLLEETDGLTTTLNRSRSQSGHSPRISALDAEGTSARGRKKLGESMLELRIKASIFDNYGVYRGYVDDERNTDNAWIE